MTKTKCSEDVVRKRSKRMLVEFVYRSKEMFKRVLISNVDDMYVLQGKIK